MTFDNNKLEKLAAKAQTFYAKNRSAHMWDHVIRVSVTAKKIALTEQSVDLEILYAMIYLHDIIRYEDERENQSVKESLSLAENILQEFHYPPPFIKGVTAGIASHSIHQIEKITPKSIEAKILFDADKIDAVGPIGIARWLMVQSNKNISIKNAAELYLNSLAKMSSGSQILFTHEGNRLLQKKLTHTKDFFEDLLSELSLS